MFHFGDDVFGNTSNIDQTTVCVHIQYSDVLDSMFYFCYVFGSYLYLGDVRIRVLAIGDFILVTCLEAIPATATSSQRALREFPGSSQRAPISKPY